VSRFAVEGHLSVDGIRHVAAVFKKLHDFLARARPQRPWGFRFHALLEPTNLVALIGEVHLRQTAPRRSPRGTPLFPQLNDSSPLHQSLPPDFHERFLKGRLHFGRAESKRKDSSLVAARSRTRGYRDWS
jgi:hypothetical protein